MPLFLPNVIENDTTADAVEVEQNNGVITQYVNTNLINRDGSVAMTNPLLLAGDPTSPNQAANKAYVDARVATQLDSTEADALYVNVTGDTVTGQLKGIAPVAVEDLTRKDYVDTADALKVSKAGDVLTGQLKGIAPLSVDDLTRKDYVDARVQSYVPAITNIPVTGNNIPQGLTGLTGTATLLPSTINYNWAVIWYYNLSNHSTGSEYRVRVIDASTGAALAISGNDHYDAGESHTSFYMAHFGPRTALAYLGFQLEIVTVGANTNVGGLVVCIGAPA